MLYLLFGIFYSFRGPQLREREIAVDQNKWLPLRSNWLKLFYRCSSFLPLSYSIIEHRNIIILTQFEGEFICIQPYHGTEVELRPLL